MKKTVKQYITDFMSVLLGGVIFSVGIEIFCIPNRIIPGGLTGVAGILRIFFNVPIGLFSLFVNVILFAFSFRILKRKVFIKSAAAVVVFSVLLDVCSDVFSGMEYTENPLLASVFGGILSGVGLGLIYTRGIATGGVDLIALLLEKVLPFISYAKLIVIIDLIVVVTSGIVFSDVSVTLYAGITVYLSGRVIDRILSGLDSAKAVYIISEKSDEISSQLLMHIKRGLTRLPSVGGYTEKRRDIVLVVIRNTELFKVKRAVFSVDKTAFVIVTDATEVVGKGFKPEEDTK